MSKKIQILYVDDEQNLRLLVKEQLSSEGYAVETADDGDTAIDMIKKHEYDLVLLDIRMPRVSGLDVLKYIRTQKLHCRVLMLTAVDDLSVALEAVKIGANDYLTKPYEVNVLLSSIHRLTATAK